MVETREVALAEAGELLIPIAEGAIDAGHVVADLAETVRGAEVRRSPEDITLFKSVGMAFEDLVVARAVVDADAVTGADGTVASSVRCRERGSNPHGPKPTGF